MSKTKRVVFIVGERSDYFISVENMFLKNSGEFFDYTFSYGDWNQLFESLDDQLAILIVDFTHLTLQKDFLFYSHQILNLKRSQVNHLLPIIGFFDDSNSLWKNSYLIYSGINYFHIIGDDIRLFFGNIYYICFEDEDYFLKLSRGIKLQVSTTLSHSFSLTRVSDYQLRVEGDLGLPEEFSSRIYNAFDNRKLMFELTDHLSQSETSNSMNSYDIDFNFSNSWGNDQEELVFEDDVVTWISNLKEDNEIIEKSQVKLHIYANNESDYFKKISEFSSVDLNCTIFKKFKENDLELYPFVDFIIFDCQLESDLDDVDLLLTYYSNQQDTPVILLLNHPSSTQAIKKMYDYELLLSVPNTIGMDELVKMLDMIRINKKIEPAERIDPLQNIFFLEKEIEVVVTSLSENEITFKTVEEIPFFTHILLQLPDSQVFVTIVPSFINLEPNIHGFHYLGLINLCEEEDRQVLRKSVRRFIRNLPTSWDGIDLISDDELKEHEGDEEGTSQEMSVNAEEEGKPEDNEIHKILRKNKINAQINKQGQRKRTQGRKSKL